MKPLHCIIENFGAYCGRQEIDFRQLDNLFLVCGPTGSGKTTIFDAISFALYAKLPGSRNDLKPDQFRSKYSAQTEKSGVELLFSCGQTMYRISRYLAYNRPKARGAGTTPEPDRVCFEVSTNAGADWQTLTKNKLTDTNSAIIDRIKITAEEFWKIVILPQGDFQKFLEADSTERKKILTLLFPIDVHQRIMDLAIATARDFRDAIGYQEKRLKELLDEKSEADTRQELADLDLEIKSLSKKSDALNARKSLVETHLAQAHELQRQFDDCNQKESLLSELELQRNNFDDMGQQVKMAHSAETVLPDCRLAERLKKELAENRCTCENAKTTVDKADLDLKNAQKESLALESLRKKHNALQEERGTINGMIQSWDRLNAIRIDLEKTEKNENLQKKRRDEAQQHLSGLQTDEKKFKVTPAEQEQLAVMNKRLVESPAATLREKVQNLKAAANSLTECAQSIQKVEWEIERHTAAIGKHSGELQTLRARKEASFAFELSRTLQPGAPCPVCGSAEHPAPAATATHAEAFTGQVHLEAIEKQLNDLNRLQGMANGRLQELHVQEQALRQNQKALMQGLTRAGADSIEAAQAIIVENDTLKKAAGDLQKSINDRNIKHQATIEKIESARRALLEADLILQERSGARQKLQGQHEQLADQLKGVADPHSARAICDANLKTVSCTIDLLIAAEKCAQQKFDQAFTTLQEKTNALHTAENKVRDHSAGLASLLTEKGFSDPDAVARAAREPATIEKLETAIKQYRESSLQLTTQIHDLQKSLAGKSAPDTQALVDQAAVITAELVTVKTDYNLKISHQGVAEKHLKNIADTRQECEKAGRSGGAWIEIANNLSGDNPLRLNFVSFVLQHYLRCVLKRANQRLLHLSEGRYLMRLREEIADKRSQTGLDLDVFDSYNNETRPVKSLSGGEKFLASISLALGLSDEIQTRAGGIQLESMFVDEGFGTLDNDTKERAIGILDSLGTTRMVGIISHVEELRERIPSKIIVEKRAGGSRITVENG
jgi:exonuclease SbcC